MSICLEINKCLKVERILDQDLAGDWQYAEGITATCTACEEKVETSKQEQLREKLNIYLNRAYWVGVYAPKLIADAGPIREQKIKEFLDYIFRDMASLGFGHTDDGEMPDPDPHGYEGESEAIGATMEAAYKAGFAHFVPLKEEK